MPSCCGHRAKRIPFGKSNSSPAIINMGDGGGLIEIPNTYNAETYEILREQWGA